MKIQFLRLIHNLVSKDELDVAGKLLFFSRQELNTLLLYPVLASYFSDEVRAFVTFFYTELNVSEDVRLKEFFSLINRPPTVVPSIYEKLYTSGDPIGMGHYLLGYAHASFNP